MLVTAAMKGCSITWIDIDFNMELRIRVVVISFSFVRSAVEMAENIRQFEKRSPLTNIDRYVKISIVLKKLIMDLFVKLV